MDDPEFLPRDLWLQSDATWKESLGPEWYGRKIGVVLGRGGYGVVGLWQYNGPGNPAVTQVAVKSTIIEYFDRKNPKWLREGTILKMAQAAKSPHIIRLFGNQSRDRAAGDIYSDVIRLFMEFCPGGDLHNLYEERWAARKRGVLPEVPLLEADLWCIFHCLALGVGALDRGTEDLTSRAPLSWDRNHHIVHYDLKPENVFFSNRDKDHTRVPLVKIADFGLARLEPRRRRSSSLKRIGRQPRGGTVYYRPPEANNDWFKLRRPRKGPYTNVYQIGAIMHNLVARRDSDQFFIPINTWRNTLRGLFKSGETQGVRMDNNDVKGYYSKALRELIMDCMNKEPLNRPSTEELQRRTLQGREVAAESARMKRPSNDQNDINWDEVAFITNQFPEPPAIQGRQFAPRPPPVPTEPSSRNPAQDMVVTVNGPDEEAQTASDESGEALGLGLVREGGIILDRTPIIVDSDEDIPLDIFSNHLVVDGAPFAIRGDGAGGVGDDISISGTEFEDLRPSHSRFTRRGADMTATRLEARSRHFPRPPSTTSTSTLSPDNRSLDSSTHHDEVERQIIYEARQADAFELYEEMATPSAQLLGTTNYSPSQPSPATASAPVTPVTSWP
ncbi:hypothetical protein HYFRA_00005621 [Hymenoscyphus fraxineus]|uniref:non-specific serine/threonine protein kinase n=1 Tax=Hymenoscyphus fraxineus TaxID=746836 RepID=A0A9N9PRT9_9HELO|nr:hypothetical protein HYFRA_00005621 [Hymenoscyphus fraxineus]